MNQPSTPPATEATVLMAAQSNDRFGRETDNAICRTSWGIGKKELSAKEIAAKAGVP